MIPKVASHILQHTSRAAAAVQAQTTQSIRNALQYQSATPGSSSSGWGSTGGAKHNAGSKFYGHTQTNVDGHFVNQTNSASSHGAGASDELDDYKKRITVLMRQPAFSTASAVKTRARSSSHSSGLSINRNLGVLEAIHKYARYKHSLAIEAAPAVSPTPDRVFIRRNSTSSPSVASDEVPASTGITSAEELTELSSAELEAMDLELDRKPRPSSPHPGDAELARDFAALRDENYDSVLLQEFHYALSKANVARIEQLITEFHEQGAKSIHFYNIALRAAAAIRAPGQPIGPFIAVYNEMLSNKIHPNGSTYKILISVFCERDFEVQRAIVGVRGRQQRRSLLTRDDPSKGSLDAELLARLQKEESIHFQSAMELFSLMAPRFSDINLATYISLLRSCSLHADIDQAIKVYAHLERHFRNKNLSPVVYYYLVQVYRNVKDVQGAQEVFKEFKEASRTGRLDWFVDDTAFRPLIALKAQIRVYNCMLSVYMSTGQSAKAVGLLEQMIYQNGGLESSASDIPPPNARSFNELITGFLDQGDIDSALSWHNRLVKQESKALEDLEAPILTPTRPNVSQWEIIVEACAVAGPLYVDTLNALWSDFVKNAELDGFGIRAIHKHMVLEANLRIIAALAPTDPRAVALLDFLVRDVVPVPTLLAAAFLHTGAVPMRDSFVDLARQLSRGGRYSDAISTSAWMFQSEMQTAKVCEAQGSISNDIFMHHGVIIRHFIQIVTDDMVKACGDNMSLSVAVQLGVLRHTATIGPRHDLAIATLRAYASDRASGLNTLLSVVEWDRVLECASGFVQWTDLPDEVKREVPEPDFMRMLYEIRDQNIDVRKLFSRKRLVAALVSHLGIPKVTELFQSLGDNLTGHVFTSILNRHVNNATMKSNLESTYLATDHPGAENVVIDQYHSRVVEEYYPSHRTLTPLDGFKRFEQGVLNNIYPSPEVIARLIGSLGRIGHLDKVRTLYNAAQVVLSSLETKDKQWQSLGWYAVEDAMIIALAHAGDIPAAHVHRQRILQYRGVPSADAYGALISTTKDTTDDVASALALWDESQTLGVRPHIFLYNTIISKLAKARKVDYALSLFQKMKLQGIRPSSVTFGAMISACARVGDAISAEHLFQEMASMNNYKPRIPPFNTMMQMYTYTKPDRARVMHYYEQLLTTGIPPNGHTYKVLMDAYSTIEPVDFNAMETVFSTLCADKNVAVVGSHWASLINAYGCVARDLDRAVEIFDRIASHPSSLRSAQPMPDAVVYEAIINVLVTLHRIDLVPQYMQRLAQSGVHMTAYVANLLIKGHAAAGNIDEARTTFESLVDPPEGVAAPNNHVPHGATEQRALPLPDSPVYREPSTWEAMVRAELGFGDPGRVEQLLQRMESRRYPPGVINRIRGILSSDMAPELGTPINQAYQAGVRLPGFGLFPVSESSTPPPV